LGTCKNVFSQSFNILQSTSIVQIADDLNLRVFPNPPVNFSTVVWNGKDSYDLLRISDISGRTVQVYDVTSKANGNQLQFDVSHLNGGVYFLSLESKNSIKSIRFNIR